MRINSILSGPLSFQRATGNIVLPTFQSYSFPPPTLQGIMHDAYTALTFCKKDEAPESKPIQYFTGNDFIDWSLTRLQELGREQTLLREMQEEDDDAVLPKVKVSKK